MDVVIYHNPACGTSRNVLALIRHVGVEPRVVEYLNAPPSRAEIADLAARMGVGVRDILREKEGAFAELGLGDLALTEDQLLDAVAAHPALLQRPIVVSPMGVKMCRPSEAVLDLLPSENLKPFAKADGEVVIDADGRRVL